MIGFYCMKVAGVLKGQGFLLKGGQLLHIELVFFAFVCLMEYVELNTEVNTLLLHYVLYHIAHILIIEKVWGLKRINIDSPYSVWVLIFKTKIHPM